MKGETPVVDEAACTLIAQYASQTRLAKLGYTQPFDNLDPTTMQAFLLIDGELDKLRKKESEKALKKKSPARR